MNNEKIISQLGKVGLDEKSARIYAYLLETGGAYPSKIAEDTKINRSTVYKILLTLSIKGLVSEVVKGKKLYYQIEKPQKLLRSANDNLKRAKNILEHAERLMPEMEAIYNLIPNKPQVKFFEGVDGVKSIYEDHTFDGKKYEMLGFSNTAHVLKFLSPEFLRNYVKQKEKISITTRGITPDAPSDVNYARQVYRNVKKRFWPVIRHVKKDFFPYEIELTIYSDNKISLLKLDSDKPIGVIIEDKIFHDTMKMIFELAWDGAK
jgi:HTH-type transcriptional regulator, sugar sensing transcriptional regulator